MSGENELRQLRLDLGIPAKDMVAVVQAIYPKYDKTMQSKCERGDEYGVDLRPDALKALYDRFAPGKEIEPKRPKKENRRLTARISCRLEDADSDLLQQRMEADGYTTNQDLLTALVRRYIRKEAPRVNDIPDHPVIRNMERTGYPDGKEPTYPRCPICGEECETIYRDRYGAYVGCDVCTETKDAWEVSDCFPEKE